jgi:S1-C subfamily serine protease
MPPAAPPGHPAARSRNGGFPMSGEANGGRGDDPLAQLSEALAERVAAAAGCVVSVHSARGRPLAGILWRPDLVVTSEQFLPSEGETKLVLPGGGVEVSARPVGRDPGTNVALLRPERPGPGAQPRPVSAEAPRLGALALLLGGDGAGGATARLALVHAVGPAWHSMAGGRIDRLIRLDARLRGEEGGPVLDAATGGLLGMSTSGPRGRVLVIPAATVERVLDPLLREGRIPRGWLGVSLQPVAIPEALRGPAGGQDSALMVLGLARGGPAEAAGVLPGDILLALDGRPVAQPRAVAEALGPDRVGQTAVLRLLRGGAAQDLAVTIAPRPAPSP